MNKKEMNILANAIFVSFIDKDHWSLQRPDLNLLDFTVFGMNS